MDKPTQKRIVSFLEKKIDGTLNPRLKGKALRGNKAELWRYRIGNYRLICHLDDNTVTVLVIGIGHRKAIYRKM